MNARHLIAVACLGSLACATDTTPLRFHNRPVAWRAADRTPIERPSRRFFLRNYNLLQGHVMAPATRALSLPVIPRAGDTNALDEVPDSTWFENRIGHRPLSASEVRRGANTDGGPEQHKPWTIRGTKVGGVSVGFQIEDARGVRYLLKFDERGSPQIETAADVVTQRLLWAIGYHVPEDEVVRFTPDELLLADGAKESTPGGISRPLTQERLTELLKLVEKSPDGTIRGLTSRFVSGKPVGGYATRGRRGSDVNDVVDHEHRRTIRGQHVFFAWLDHTDLKEDNWLDVWVETDEASKRGFLQHYLLDFGKALGAQAYLVPNISDGFAYDLIDSEYFFPGLFGLGLYVAPWEQLSMDGIPPGVGLFTSTAFDPASWRPHFPFYPFEIRDPSDDLWAAKILARIKEPHIRAAVAAGRYESPAAADYVVKVLLERREIVLRWALGRMSPLDGFTAERRDDGLRVCFNDVWRTAGFELEGHYTAEVQDFAGTALGSAKAEAHGERSCIGGLSAGDSEDGYTMVEVAAVRAGGALPEVVVHIANTPEGEPRVIGVSRALP